MAGLSLAASGVLQGFGHLHVLMFLAATYLIWGLGLHANLKANWVLLQETGTSTNALSKAAHDLMKLRTASLRVQRFAASVGYTGTELAKEAPYYAGVFGAVLFTDSVSSNDAIVFLGGANLAPESTNTASPAWCAPSSGSPAIERVPAVRFALSAAARSSLHRHSAHRSCSDRAPCR